MRNSQTPPRHEPKPAKTAPQKNCLTLLSDARKKDETRPCKTHLQTKNQPLGSPCETAKHHLDTSPNQPKPHRKKKLPNAAFWCPKERWTSTVQNAPPNQKPTSRQPMRNSQTPPRHEPKPAKTGPQKNCLTLLSDAPKTDETRPCKTLGSPCETAKHHLDTSPNQPKPHRKKTA